MNGDVYFCRIGTFQLLLGGGEYYFNLDFTDSENCSNCKQS